jgi:hypothetical protein
MKVESENHIVKQGVFRKSIRVGTKQKIKTMKNLIILFLSLTFIALLPSCSKCGRCVTGGIEGPEKCQKDGQAAYNLAKNSCSGFGKWVEE